MSARRELLALWSRCDRLRERVGPVAVELPPDARRLLDQASEELASAVRRLESARMLTPGHAAELGHAQAGLAAARCGGLPLGTAVARYAFALQEVAAAFHIDLVPNPPDLVVAAVTASAPAPNGSAPPAANGHPAVADAPQRPAESAVGSVPIRVEAADGAPGAPSEAVEALAFVTSVAVKGGHRLGGFSGSGGDTGYRFTARCADCGDQVSVLRQAELWSFTPVVACSHGAARPA
ncbi:MAG: hypothetical protein JWM18_4311 [Chloroflexi bacterium]|jgi:hypothetical protein|nr:hypothetical protein [Chloroflexota bacterium]